MYHSKGDKLSKGNNTSIEVKKKNRNRVYKHLYYHGGKTLKEISEELDMSMPTVIQIVKALKSGSLVKEGECLESTGGRRARLLSCDHKVRFSLGIDVTRHHVTFIVIDIKGEIIHSRRVRLSFQNVDAYFQRFGDLLREFLGECSVPKEKILGAGVSIPGIISEDNRYMRHGGVIDFVNGELSRFSEQVPYRCLFSNDANAGGYAELWREDTVDKAVYLSLSNSVGGAILFRNSIYNGDNQKSGEFGHMTLVENGRQCYCGRKGCLDAYCSAHILEKSGGTLEGFFERLKAGEQEQRRVWEDYKRYLVLAINNIRVCFDCQVVLGGYVGSYLEDHLGELKESLEQYLLFENTVDYLRICYYKREASAVGAALLHVKEFIESI